MLGFAFRILRDTSRTPDGLFILAFYKPGNHTANIIQSFLIISKLFCSYQFLSATHIKQWYTFECRTPGNMKKMDLIIFNKPAVTSIGSSIPKTRLRPEYQTCPGGCQSLVSGRKGRELRRSWDLLDRRVPALWGRVRELGRSSRLPVRSARESSRSEDGHRPPAVTGERGPSSQ